MNFERISKYYLYENSVLTPTEDMELFANMYRQVFTREPLVLREDFCGTYVLSAAWLKRSDKHQALALDLDPEPLEYGRKVHYKMLTPIQKKNLTVMQQDVRTVTKKKADLAVANNFSFYIFKTRSGLKEYFQCARQSLKAGQGLFLVELAGGPGMIVKSKERRTIRVDKQTKFTYFWDQKSFDPVNQHGMFAIHFGLNGKLLRRDEFVYDWRLWTIPEVRDLMVDAGFRKTVVFWEKSSRGEGTGEYLLSERGDNDWSWIAYVGGVV